MAKGDGRIVSFAWTADALFAVDHALQKTETRRLWNDRYARSFKAGQIIQAYDQNPRVGGKRIALLRLTRDPYQERLCDMPGNAWFREGFEWLQRRGRTVDDVTPRAFWSAWRTSTELRWVICFEMVKDCRQEVLDSDMP